ncbi:HAD hydrolase-like protein [Oribacterium parvum]|mgnify:FL=1|jgi:5'-nucleotidase|uniref:HAD hydrolase-like protein n=1 Tax=Oribacterium parvum TaxID=1501329 RepID=UPI0028DBA105|nr:HAD hydrolase-like protein [Oribacterium parvum]
MGKYKNILLDLDGTILDSGSGIIKSVQYVLDHFSMYHEPEEKLRKFIGPALIDSFMNFYGFSKEKAEEAVEYFRDYYPEKGMFDAFIYPGMRECIEKMAGDGKKLVLLTSKPIFFASQILQHFGLSDYFFMEIGPDLSEQSSDKTRLIEKALREGNFLKEDCLMVGDTKYDILAAKDVGIDSVAALYGYGEVEEISIAKYSIEKPLDLLSIA